MCLRELGNDVLVGNAEVWLSRQAQVVRWVIDDHFKDNFFRFSIKNVRRY